MRRRPKAKCESKFLSWPWLGAAQIIVMLAWYCIWHREGHLAEAPHQHGAARIRGRRSARRLRRRAARRAIKRAPLILRRNAASTQHLILAHRRGEQLWYLLEIMPAALRDREMPARLMLIYQQCRPACGAPAMHAALDGASMSFSTR